MAGSERSRRKFSAEGFAIAALAAVLLFAASVGNALIAGASLTRYEIAGDTIPRSLTGAAGDPARGRAILGTCTRAAKTCLPAISRTRFRVTALSCLLVDGYRRQELPLTRRSKAGLVGEGGTVTGKRVQR
jgi:hypothetical protein